MSKTIIGVKIVAAKRNQGEKLILRYKETLPDKSHSASETTFDRPFHPDLRKAVQKLAVYYAMLTDFISDAKTPEPEDLEKFHVSGYSIGGGDDTSGITITGHRKGKFGATILNSPFQRWEQNEETGFPLLRSMESDVDDIEAEIALFLSGEKVGAIQQELPLPDENDPVTHAQILPPEARLFIEQGAEEGEPEPLPPAEAPEEVVPKVPPRKQSKRVAQTSATPSGIVEE